MKSVAFLSWILIGVLPFASQTMSFNYVIRPEKEGAKKPPYLVAPRKLVAFQRDMLEEDINMLDWAASNTSQLCKNYMLKAVFNGQFMTPKYIKTAHSRVFQFSGFGKNSSIQHTGSNRIPLLLAKELSNMHQIVTNTPNCPVLYFADYLFTRHCSCVQEARLAAPHMKIVVAKPGHPNTLTCSKEVDFVIVDNNLQLSMFTALGIKAIQLKLVEEFPSTFHTPKKIFTPTEPATLCYHGNGNHFKSLIRHLSKLQSTSFGQPFKLFAVVPYFNQTLKTVRRWTKFFNFSSEIVSYNHKKMSKWLNRCDVGLVPQYRFVRSECRNGCLTSDVTVRYKFTANAGRAFVFLQLGVPVIADSVTEVSEVIGYNSLGILLDSTDHITWLNSVRYLLNDYCLRRFFSSRSRTYATHFLSPSVEAAKVLSYLGH